MAPKNLTFEEICDNKSMELVKLELKNRRFFYKKRNLGQQQQFLEELVLKFVDKINEIRLRDNLSALQKTPEIKQYQYEIARLEDKIGNLTYEIQDLTTTHHQIEEKIEVLKKQFREFVSENGRRLY